MAMSVAVLLHGIDKAVLCCIYDGYIFAYYFRPTFVGLEARDAQGCAAYVHVPLVRFLLFSQCAGVD